MTEPLTVTRLQNIISGLPRKEAVGGKFILVVNPSTWRMYKAAKIMRLNRAKRRRHD